MKSNEALESLVDRYCAAWGEFDAVRREQVLRDIWAENATYTDPRGRATGIAELTALIASVQASRPGAKWARTSVVDAHHGLVRFAWRVTLADGTALPEGIDFAEISPDGRILMVVGFLGALERL
jgi:hypothetical protein